MTERGDRMKLLKYEDVIKAVDEHTNDDGRLDDDITCILEEVPAANHNQKFVKWLKNRGKEARDYWDAHDDEQSFGEMIAYTNVYGYLRSHGIIGGDTE